MEIKKNKEKKRRRRSKWIAVGILQTAPNKRMAVQGSKPPFTQMPAAPVVAASCPLRSGGVLSQSLKAPSTRSTALRRYYIIGGHFAMRQRCGKLLTAQNIRARTRQEDKNQWKDQSKWI